MEKRLEGKVAIVTGANRGIGKAIATLYAQHGASVLVVFRNDGQAAERTVAELQAKGGICSVFRADVSQEAETRAMVAAAIERYGGIDLLCANAAIFPSAPIEELTVEMWDDMQAVNLKGTFLAVKACVPQMKAQRYGKIVIISSITGPHVGLVGLSNYGASKAGQLGFMSCAALELAEHRITINAILPGTIATEVINDWLGEEKLGKLARSIPMQSIGDPMDIAYGALFFSTDESRYVTGQTLVIDGGVLLPEMPLHIFD